MISKNKKIIISLIVLVGIAVIGFIVWRSTTTTTTTTTYPGIITIGEAPWPGYIIFFIARDKGYFRDAGLNVEIRPYDSLEDVSKDYVAGKLQGRANLTLDAIREAYEGLNHKVVLAIDHSAGSDAIMARADIKTVADFKDKRIAFEQGTLEEFFITWALDDAGLTLKDVTSIPANPEESARLLQEGKVDVAVTYEPFISQLISKQGFHKVYSSKDAPGLITDVLTFRNDFIEQYPDAVEAFIGAYFRGLDFLKTNPDEAHAILAKELKDTSEGVAKQLEGVQILDKRDNVSAFTFAAGLESLYGNMRRIGEFVHSKRGATEKPIDTDNLIDKSFIRTLTEK
jgi:NitT/TauT family transport system substrate-binding protein